jgi:integrase
MTRAWVRTSSGGLVEQALPRGLTREQGTKLARLTAAERERSLIVGRRPGEETDPVTLLALLDAYHGSEVAGRWKLRTREEKGVGRDFWLGVLGREASVLDLSPSVVEVAAQRAGLENGWSPRSEGKRLAYLRAAVRWAYRRRRMIPRNPLEGVELPEYQPDTSALIYTEEEVRRLVATAPGVDWRVTLAASIAYDTGRRITAISHLRLEDLTLEGGRLYLHFRAGTDKRGRGAIVAVSRETALLLADAVERPEVEESGWLIPGGREELVDEIRGPLTRHALGSALHRAEDVLGIPRIPGRAYHGIKRRHVTTSMELSHGDTALVGDLTGNLSADLLRRVYRQQSRDRVTAQVDLIREAIRGPEKGNEHLPEHRPSETEGVQDGSESE